MSELDKLRTSGNVEEEVDFGSLNSSLRYGLTVSATSDVLTAEFDGRSVVVIMPATQAREWAGSDLISVESLQPLGGGRLLRILVEKDFACLTPRKHEDEKDAFPNPFVTGEC